ncbi:diguanylate cyclase domain-containing protein [Halopseudomonas salegens]|uniref:Diguanylate cyclase (GGDEF) domain-containing protein n=1 Tax=Halopseudomonas salegens TaxID=1434072 RepID=A0A1H2ENE7_9GAMM|nr:diguanylate cyclase [Halopseudomonas salegens]SDT96268.1 diguanylate cyclase (GGDEF) domain-containing protein [Halopseudomonas salegens]
MHSELQLPGFMILSCLWRKAGRVAYRAQRIADGANVCIETLDTEYPDRRQVAILNHEANIASRLDGIKGVRKVHAVVPHGSGNLALVSDHYEGSLATLLQANSNGRLPVLQVLDIARTLARILGDIHAHDIVHKALAPQNILYAPHNGALALSGFGIASELGQERQMTRLPSQPEAELAYISPEQTGRMNRSLDYRSDYYSLGALLFELLTGRPPFNADNTLEWVHSHISRLPPAPDTLTPGIPEAVSGIILKLLAKPPEERYQSSHGLEHDLSRCAVAIEKDQRLPAFPLGEKDHLQKFLIPQALYGRERELQTLFDLFEQAVAGQTSFCLVHGYSGVGKSALVNEIDQHQVRERGFLVQSKFDQFQQGEAYSALAATFRALVQQILLEPTDQLANWGRRLTSALGPNGALMIDLVPELALIIGEQPPVNALPPAESRNRLQLVLTAFLRVFASKGHPVILFLDDLQWSDTPTLNLLRHIVTSREQSHLLLIGAYRSNEVGHGHPLRLLLDELNNHARIHQIHLTPLDQQSIEQLVADALRCEPDSSRALSEMLFHRARGNPFFTNELLRQLHAQGAIWSDPGSGQWYWQLDKASWEKASNDVVEFMLDNLRQLPEETRNVLQLAACIGNSFTLQTLATIYEHSLSDTARALLPALQQYTVLPLHNDYRLAKHQDKNLAFNPDYRFQHDRVQQAAYSLIPSEELPRAHLSVGRLMLQHSGGQIADEQLIDIVNHLNQGRTLLGSDAKRQQLAEFNLRAARRAREASAYQQALDYLLVAEEMLPLDAWSRLPALMTTLAAEMQLSLYLTGRIEEADRWLEQMLEHAESPLQRADILAIRTRQNATLGRMEASIHAAIEGLALLGVNFTENPSEQDIALELQRVDEYLAGRAIPDLVNAPIIDDPATLTAMRLLMEIFAAAFLSGSKLFSYLVLKSVNLALHRGNCPESAFAYAAYGMLLCGELDEPALGYEYGKVGLAINERLDDLSLRARVIYVYAMFVHHWSNHWSSLTPWFRKGIEAGYQSGDLLYLAYSAQDCVIWDPGMDLETARQQHAENLEIVRECAYQDSLDSGSLFLQMQRNFLGDTQAPSSLSSDDFDAEHCLDAMKKRNFLTGIANHAIYSAEINLLYGNYDQALHFVKKQDQLIKSAMSLPQLVRFYIVANLTLATLYPDMDKAEQQNTRQRLEQDLARMTRWADNCAANFRHLQWLMTAELARLDGDHDAALAYFDDAIDTARLNGFLHDEATAFERAARHLLALGKRRSAEGYLRGAHGIYSRWGAQRKVELLEDEFPVLRAWGQAQFTPPGSHLSTLDIASVMKASREISGEIVLDQLLQKTLAILLENAGGQWGCLIVRAGGVLIVEAAILPEEQPAHPALPEHCMLKDYQGNSIALPMSVISQVFQRGKAVVLHDAMAESPFDRDPYTLHLHPRSVLCVPIARERFEAAVYMENDLTDAVFTDDRVELIQLLAAQAAVAIENARLYTQVQEHSRTLEEKVVERTAKLEELNKELQRLADRDGLTGVANRRSGDAYLKDTWLRLRRQPQPLSVIMLDVDHFKLFNDNYGHQMGDDCLIRIARALQTALQRSTDMVARYGGEEFILILPDTDNSGAIQVAENARQAVEALGIRHEHSTTRDRITVSVGYATMTPDEKSSAEELVYAADAALYKAKQSGRNRIHAANNA